jgi:hypothetical protein
MATMNDTVHPEWCASDEYHGDGPDRMRWHQALLAEVDGVTIHLVMPHQVPANGAADPQWRLTIHDETVPLPASFSTWTVLDLMWATEQAANALEELLEAVPDGNRDFESLR